MAATSAYTTAWYEDDRRLARPQTYFTKYLADLVETGIPGQPSRLHLDPLFKQLRENLATDRRPVPYSRGVNDARNFEFACNAAPPEAQRDPDREIKDLTRRVAEAEARRIEAEAARARDLAEAEARERALRAEMAERNRELERLHGQARGSPPLADEQPRQLQDAIQAADFRLDEATTAHAAAGAQAAAASHVTAKPETVPAARPAPPSDAPPPATVSDAPLDDQPASRPDWAGIVLHPYPPRTLPRSLGAGAEGGANSAAHGVGAAVDVDDLAGGGGEPVGQQRHAAAGGGAR